jgi:hypothetical protein
MSKRHTASRRRTYGRRQHELHERVDRRAEQARPERSWRADQALEPVRYLDAPSTGQPSGFN